MHASAHSNHQLREAVAELAINASVELSLGDASALGAAADLLPRGTSIFVPAPVSRPFATNLSRVRKVAEAGFEPVPHIAARGIPSRHELRSYLGEIVGRCGVRRVMLIGGDHRAARGSFTGSVDVLAEEVLAEAGIQSVGIAGYPEGHPFIPTRALQEDLERKKNLANRQGLGMAMVTQFSFTPSRVIDYCAWLARAMPEMPVYVGIAGPAGFRGLRRFARRCGVSASVRALRRFGSTAVESAMHTDTDEQVTALAHYCVARDACNVIGVHLFGFGGFLDTAHWLRRQCRPG